MLVEQSSENDCSALVAAGKLLFGTRNVGYEMIEDEVGGSFECNSGSEALLPARMMPSASLSELPVLPGLYIDAQHIIGQRPDRAERGWFDVIALADGRAAMVVGDVVEPDAEAGLSPERVRTILAEILSDGLGLEAVLEKLNRSAHGRDAARNTTLSVAVLDPRSGTVDYCTRDHPPPLVVTADGRTRLLPPTGGKDQTGNPSSAVERERLAHDDVLVLHTGGISPAMTPSSAELLTSTAAETGKARAGEFEAGKSEGGAAQARTEEVCRAAAAGIRHRGTREDLAVLAAQLKPPVPGLTLTVPAVAESVAPTALAVGDWMAGLRSSIEDGAGMALAMGEAVTNAIQHAFVGTRPGSVLVECMLLGDGVLVCSVSDDGRWLPAESSKRGRTGRGLRMMARVCDRLLIHCGASGTVVELRRRLHHPVIRSTGPL